MFVQKVFLKWGRLINSPHHLQLALLQVTPPGPAALKQLTSIEVASVDMYDHVVLLKVWERQRAWLDAAQQPILVAVGGERSEEDWGRAEIGAALRLSSVTAQRRLDVARDLVGRLRMTLAALSEGRLSYLHAARLAADTAGLSRLHAAIVEATVLPYVIGRDGKPGQTLAAFGRTIAEAVITVDPKAADERHQDAAAGRSLTDFDTGDATGGVVVKQLPADQMRMVMAVLRARAAKTGADDQRTRDQRLADAFVGVFADAHSRLDLPLAHGRRPVTSLVLDVDTWAGLADHAAHLDGYGPIPPAMARRIAADSDFRRLIIDPLTGHLLDLSPRTYRPSQALTDFVIARDRTCDFTTCGRQARHCELDHITEFQRGGTTSRQNLKPACKHEHRMRHHTRWRLEMQPDGSAIWTSPAGHTYPVAPFDYRPLE